MTVRRREVWASLALAFTLAGVTSIPCEGLSGAERDRANLWAVIVDTSTYWRNYRHNVNALSLYRAVRRLGLPDSRIVLMVAEDFSTDPRNVKHGGLFMDPDLKEDLCEGGVEIDFVGDEVTADNLVRVLTNRFPPETPNNKRVLSDGESNVLVYITGHGAENFMHFREDEMLLGEDLATALRAMRDQARFRQLLLIVDTCQASTFYQHVSIPGVTCLASSGRGESSYSKHFSAEVGVAMVDQMTYHLANYLAALKPGDAARKTMQQLVHWVRRQMAADEDRQKVSEIQVKPDPAPGGATLREMKVGDFFSGGDHWRAEEIKLELRA